MPYVLKHGGPSSLSNIKTYANQSAHRIDPSKRAQIRLNLGSRLTANARSADRAFAADVTNNTAYFPFSFLFAKRMTPIIRASAMTKFEFDGYNNKFDVNNNKI